MTSFELFFVVLSSVLSGFTCFFLARFRESEADLLDCRQRLVCKDLEIEAIRETSDSHRGYVTETMFKCQIGQQVVIAGPSGLVSFRRES